jgi:hypothetical protein
MSYGTNFGEMQQTARKYFTFKRKLSKWQALKEEPLVGNYLRSVISGSHGGKYEDDSFLGYSAW